MGSDRHPPAQPGRTAGAITPWLARLRESATLTTDRLRLVPLVKDDAPQIQASLGNRAPSGGQFSVAIPGRRRSRYEHDCLTGCRKGAAGSGRFAARPPEQLIGLITLSDQADNNRGFWLDPAWQRQG
jgi:RimJ/RimL family protein N-acetyltransferase